MTKLKPLGLNILAKEVQREEKTKSGLYIPNPSTFNTKATVVSVGDKVTDEYPSIKKGTVIHYNSYVKPAVLDEDGHIVVSVRDVLAIEA